MPFDPYAWLKCKYGPSQPTFELGKKDEILEKNMWRTAYAPVREVDRLIYDPPVENSQVTLRDGGDSSREVQEIGYRYMGMPMDEWRYKVLYRQNPAIKHIYDNWPISDEHPGMKFRTGIKGWYGPLSEQGDANLMFKKYLGRLIPATRYYNTPDGEQCFNKSWVCARGMAFFMIPLWVHDCVSGCQPVGWRNILYQYYRISYLPVTAAWMWGAVNCLLCSYRRKNDLINPLWGSVAAGCVFGLRLGTFYGLKSGFVFMICTMTWRVLQDADVDILYPKIRFSTNLFDPTSHKWLRFGKDYNDWPKRDF